MAKNLYVKKITSGQEKFVRKITSGITRGTSELGLRQLNDVNDSGISATNRFLVYNDSANEFQFGEFIAEVDSAFVLSVYSAGSNIAIDETGIISATSTQDSDFVLTVYSSGTNISIDENGVISSTGDVDSEDLENILANPDFEIDGGTF